MARRVTPEDIKNINQIYYECKSYAETARRTGWAAATVSRYVDKNYQPIEPENVKRFDIHFDLPEFTTEIFENVELGDLCLLSNEEKVEIAELWKEIAL